MGIATQNMTESQKKIKKISYITMQSIVKSLFLDMKSITFELCTNNPFISKTC